MQVIKFVTENWVELMALWATTQIVLGGVGTLLTKTSSPTMISIGHRLEALGADKRKLVSGKSRTTEDKVARIESEQRE